MYNAISSSTPSLLTAGGTIANASISLERDSSGIDHLSISFSDGCRELSKVGFELLPVKHVSESDTNLIAFFEAIKGKGVYKIADLYPLNGTVKKTFNITDFVRPQHRKEIQQHVHKLNESVEKEGFVRLMVIDFKDSKIAYENRDEISKAERAFATFLKENPPSGSKDKTRKEVHDLIRENEIDFLINEGTLKADLLSKTFNPEQRAFFQDKENSPLFCQLCEVLMNGFKQGKEVVVNGWHCHPNDYVVALKTCAAFAGTNPLGDPFLQTYYPKNYKGVYSDTSAYYGLIIKISTVGYQHDAQEITTITIE